MEINGILRNARRLSPSEDIRGPCLQGHIYGDTKGRFRDGASIVTSTIESEEGDVFKTRFSVYKVESWSDVSQPITADRPIGQVIVAANDNGGVTIARLQEAHLVRQEEWCPDQKPDLSFRGNEMAGETGEACNVIKKLERERHGWRGSRDTHEHLGQELADVVHTAVLCAITAGIDLEPFVVEKFNATSEANGLTTRLAAA